jgi:hypothetical protein
VPRPFLALRPSASALVNGPADGRLSSKTATPATATSARNCPVNPLTARPSPGPRVEDEVKDQQAWHGGLLVIDQGRTKMLA